ncbi:MAG: SGNH/GDSL hydrolase family protein [Spirochaetia bacterium]|nr:SGNH/GDSL hydrolase family protein [Spirochaetia bacterium]MCF7940306.1 SGNH/GDSL hydrolase family protein [Spirochaetia bacterium]
MKSIVCFGDSNTWGYDPIAKQRYDRDTRWTGRLQSALGDAYHVIEEGLNGRTTVWEDPLEEGRCGKTYLYPCLQTHKPIDLVILMLGTNDLKKRFDVSAEDIVKGAEQLIKMIGTSESGRDDEAPDILLVAPSVIKEIEEFEIMFSGGREKSKEFSQRYKELAQSYKCHFLDTNTIMSVSDADGIHYEPEAHQALAMKLCKMIKGIIIQ